MSNSTIVLLIVGLVVAVGLWVYGFRVGSRLGFQSGKESQRPAIALLRDEVGGLTNENKRLQSESREVARKREENERRSGGLDEREGGIAEMENRQREADHGLMTRARKLREESEEMEEKAAARAAELEAEKRKVRRAQKKADGVRQYYLQAARSAMPVYTGDAAIERECAGVYVVAREGAVKIGMTDDFFRRFKELQAQCRSVGIIDLRPEALVPMDEGRRIVEARVHDLFKDRQTAGEWFAVSPDDAVQEVISQAWLVKTDNARHRELRHAGLPVDPLLTALRKFSGITALHLAAAQNDVPEIERLMQSPSDLLLGRDPFLFVRTVRVEDNAGHSPMDWAVGCNATDAISALNKLDNAYLISPALRNGGRLMGLAALKGAHGSISALAKLGFGAHARVRLNDGMTLMHLAMTAECVAALVPLGGDVNATDKDGNTPLHHARDFGVVAELVKNGADINATDKDGNTPLHRARNSGVVAELVKNGADINAIDNGFETPLRAAANRHSYNIQNGIWGITSRGVVVSLMEHGADVAELEEDATLMHCAAQWDDVDLIEKLAAYDKDLVKQAADDGCTPLHTAAKWNSAKAVDKLVRLGAFVNSQAREHETPLHWTVGNLLVNAAVDAARALLANGADANARAVSGTPLDYCGKAYGHAEVEGGSQDAETQHGPRKASRAKLIKLLREYGGRHG